MKRIRHAQLSIVGLVLALTSSAGCGKGEPPAAPTSNPTATVAPPTTAAAGADVSAAAPTQEDAAATESATAAPADAGASEPAAAGPAAIVVVGASADEQPEGLRVYCEGTADGRKGNFVVTPDGAVAGKIVGPEGAVVTVQGKEVTLGKDGAPIALDAVTAVLGNGPGGDFGLINDKADFVLSWRLPDGKSGGGTLTCGVVNALAKAFAKVRQGPIRWSNEGEQHYKDDLMIIVGTSGSVALEGAPYATIYNADFIALERDVERKLAPCHYDVIEVSTGKRTGETVTKDRRAIDLSIEVYDRRTGRKIKGRSFTSPTPECPSEIPVDAVSAGVERADMGSFYDGIVKDRPSDGPEELMPPMPDVKVMAGVAGAQLPETKLPAVAAIDKRFVGLAGIKVSTEVPPTREADMDGSKQFIAFADLPDYHTIQIDAHDWSPSKKPVDEISLHVAYAIGGRTAVKVSGEVADIQVILPMMAARSFATPKELVDALGGMGWKPDYDLPAVEDGPGVESWSIPMTKSGTGLIIEYIDWGDVADGKKTDFAVARSKDGFVIVRSDVEGKAAEALAQIVK